MHMTVLSEPEMKSAKRTGPWEFQKVTTMSYSPDKVDCLSLFLKPEMEVSDEDVSGECPQPEG